MIAQLFDFVQRPPTLMNAPEGVRCIVTWASGAQGILVRKGSLAVDTRGQDYGEARNHPLVEILDKPPEMPKSTGHLWENHRVYKTKDGVFWFMHDGETWMFGKRFRTPYIDPGADTDPFKRSGEPTNTWAVAKYTTII